MISSVSDGSGMTAPRVRSQLVARLRAEGIRDERVLAAITAVPRHLFVDEALGSRAYEDISLPIGCNQTISQPYIVARMTEALLATGKTGRMLEIGTGSGYQTAVLAHLVSEVCTIERIGGLLSRSRDILKKLRCRNIRLKYGDGSRGWPEHAPYDGILITAAAPTLPLDLMSQLAPGGRLVAPVGDDSGVQMLLSVENDPAGPHIERIEPVRFVPMLRGVQ